jgi:hypothetical protein
LESSTSTPSSTSISVGPWYQGVAAERSWTLSPSVADTGIATIAVIPSPVAKRRKSASARANASCA